MNGEDSSGGGTTSAQRRVDWTFLTNHAHVLLTLARDPQCRLRDVAVLIGITERAVQAIVADLEAEGYLTRIRSGRRNTYQLHPEGHFRHPAEARHRIGELIGLFADTTPSPDHVPGSGEVGTIVVGRPSVLPLAGAAARKRGQQDAHRLRGE